ncbi:MAG TPA: methionyl-tRNA formyltransferase [Chloroflexus aurantiacus]|jgi:methionyl-tRNA formyltransferase|uniref:Methionyl-tRNA formyltransferase n=2 Tax=Chloroflexus aurantiacus TaxID=1108 RepID=FMT_CHLAA|nr:methionyl-tRNA formyltransferase [Chloroflexus aurantiacus]A9WAR0.1 RecName: Full=Methionyl-tRNA formyltransferase [Chloroflexus aurantiacus J-10-fl]B9LFJ4.1 RecName: Full=Methionyl-tRNA formyltransferase [Chloroflexus aurantiacus Y-400-fl]RMG51237.1 MAG: methionyl-tRNA formyltransferase [Chloroflexota bacterium]ABY33288.1 methionyl-tRNA formyltransferase [Chloroflexus aurantiacus J-10-fl]HBW66989.1 methionyl-tRNA formyltransferase [Chloroflexus aurantiacus]
MRILFLGSPSFAVHALEALVAAGHEIVGVVTQPDRPAGRDRRLTPPPVKIAAMAHNLPVLQPETLRDPTVVETLSALQPEVGVVAAYGEILRRAVLSIPPLGYLNIHPSLLPLYRGPTPVAGAILAGETVTGVTIMLLDPSMDSGPILAQAVVDLPPTARAGQLTDELFRIGADLLVQVLPRYARGEIEPRPQDHSRATVTKMLKKEDGRIDWSLPAIVIERMTRAYDPWPGAYTFWRGQPLRIIKAAVASADGTNVPGTVIGRSGSGHPLVQTGSDALELIEVQPASRRPMSGSAWLAGVHADNIRLGE